MSESRFTFFKQSGWLVISTGLSGVFLIAVYPVLTNMPKAEIGVFMALLKIFMILGIGTAGVQIVMAQDAARAVTDEKRNELAGAVRSVALGILVTWAVLAIVTFVYQDQIATRLKIANKGAIAVTLGLVLAQLFLPFAQGLLQGAQNFAALGWSIILNGVGRFICICIMVLLLKSYSTGALFGALLGLCAAVLLALWPSRSFFQKLSGRFDWAGWLRRVVPLSAGLGSILFLMNADVPFVQSYFKEDVTAFYSAVAMVGVGLVTFTTPMASVMFPKLVRSAAQAQKSNSLALAMAGTLILGLVGAGLCTVFPSLPLRVLFFNRPDLWQSAQLVPGFMWAMVPVTVANVLVNNLLAKQRFKAVPWLVLIALGYAIALNTYLRHSAGVDHFTAFKGVILRLGMFSTLLLAVSAAFTLIEERATARDVAGRG